MSVFKSFPSMYRPNDRVVIRTKRDGIIGKNLGVLPMSYQDRYESRVMLMFQQHEYQGVFIEDPAWSWFERYLDVQK